MKRLVILMLIMSGCHNGSYFKEDNKKILKIIHSSSGIVKRSDTSSYVRGDVEFEFGKTMIFVCDSGVYYSGTNAFFAYNVKKMPDAISKLARTIVSRECFVFYLGLAK